MTLTRAGVAEHLRGVARTSEDCGLKTLYRDGGELSENAITAAYRDVKRCVFCGKRSQVMGAQVATLEPPYAVAIGGPSERHVRLMFYGICRSHKVRAQKDPAYWNTELRRRMNAELARRVNNRAVAN